LTTGKNKRKERAGLWEGKAKRREGHRNQTEGRELALVIKRSILRELEIRKEREKSGSICFVGKGEEGS